MKNQHAQKYEYRKSIRFLLKPIIINRETKPPVKSSFEFTDHNLEEKLQEFVKLYQETINGIEKYLFFIPKDKQDDLKKDKKVLSNQLKLKFEWFKNFAKQEWFDIKDKGQKVSNKVEVTDNKVSEFLQPKLENWILENRARLDELNNLSNRDGHELARFSDISFLINSLTKRSGFALIDSLFDNFENKKGNDQIDKIKVELKEIGDYLRAFESYFADKSRFGVEIERASLNYYTVNKNPKDYDKEIRSKENALDKKYSDLKDIKFEEYDKKQKQYIERKLLNQNNLNLLKQVGFSEVNVSIGELKEKMKIFKAEQKSKLYELIVSQNNSYLDLQNSDLCLMKDIAEENFKKFSQLVEKKDKNKGNYFKFPTDKPTDKNEKTKNNFKSYYEFNNLKKKVSIVYGKLKAEKKNLEREKVDAEKLQSWAVILEKENKYYVLLIPKNTELTSAKMAINNISNGKVGDYTVQIFKSLTLRALQKLCFGKLNNSFRRDIEKELRRKYSDGFDENGKIKELYQFKNNNKSLIKFYQTVLGLEITKNQLEISNFNLEELLKKDYGNNLSDFEIDLKIACYYRNQIYQKNLDELIEKYNCNLYQITSSDLERSLDRKNLKEFTKNWLVFWTNENQNANYPIRLNPEIQISFIKSEDGYEDTKRNRRKEGRFILTISMSFNATDIGIDFGHKKTEEVVNFVKDYNQKFNKKINPEEICYYGLDRGQEELITMGVFQLTNERILEKGKKMTLDDLKSINKIKGGAVNFEVYKIKPDKFLTEKLMPNGNIRYAYKSISDFIDDEEYQDIFEKQEICCGDFSCAKVVKNKIILNGDVSAYLELKKLAAKRKIYEWFGKKEISENDKIEFDNKQGRFWVGNDKKWVYYFEEQYRDTFWDWDRDKELGEKVRNTKRSIEKELNDYLVMVRQKKEEVVTIDKINNLRKAISANIVGVIAKLQEQNFGIIVLEDLDEDQKNKHLNQFSATLGSVIEKSLLDKFKKLDLVPPVNKAAMSLQSQKQLNQFGIIKYIKTDRTSSECPACEQKITKDEHKWANHRIACEGCGFSIYTDEDIKQNPDLKKYGTDRKDLDFLNTSDDTAAYNIAKRGFET